MSDQHDHMIADILEQVGTSIAAGIGNLIGGPWGVPSGKAAVGLIRAGVDALRRGVPVAHATEALRKLKPLDYQTSRAENDARANALPEKP